MPIANVSDIVGRRDLVAEAQGWAELRLKKKELAMRQEAATKKNKPKPYNFDIADFGTNNENMFELQQNLNDQAYQYAMANSDLLSITPGTEDCGPDCKNAHIALNNMEGAADMFNKYGDNLKLEHDKLAELIETDPKNYNNEENRQKLKDMQNVWKMGMGGENYNFGFDGRGKLIVNSKKRKQTESFLVDDDGAPILNKEGNNQILYEKKGGGETTDVSKAKKNPSTGEPIKIMADMNTGEDTDFDVTQMGFGSWIGNLGFNQPNKNYDSAAFNETIADYSGMVQHSNDPSSEGHFTNHVKGSRDALQGYIFGPGGYWDDETGEGTLAGHSSYIQNLIREEKGDSHIITKSDILDKAYELGYNHQTGSSSSSSTKSLYPFDFNNQKIDAITYSRNVEFDTANNGWSGDAPTDKETSNIEYDFQGGGFNKATLDITIRLNPKNVTLMSGDNNFSLVNNNKALGKFNQITEFIANQYGVALFYNGRAIDDDTYTNLDDEEKAKCSYQTAFYGDINLGGSINDENLKRLGIQYQQMDDGNYTPAIILATHYENTMASLGDSKGTGDSNNNKMITLAKSEAVRKNKELKEELKKIEIEKEKTKVVW